MIGAVLLLVLPASSFAEIVPGFIAVALVLTMLQPRLNARFQKHDRGIGPGPRAVTLVAVFASAVYGGYFGAGQGILVIAILAVMLAQDLQRANALKTVLTGSVNGVAGVYFMFAAHVVWGPAATIAVASIVGAQFGARFAQRLRPATLRAIIVAVGILEAVVLCVERRAIVDLGVG